MSEVLKKTRRWYSVGR